MGPNARTGKVGQSELTLEGRRTQGRAGLTSLWLSKNEQGMSFPALPSEGASTPREVFSCAGASGLGSPQPHGRYPMAGPNPGLSSWLVSTPGVCEKEGGVSEGGTTESSTMRFRSERPFQKRGGGGQSKGGRACGK